MAVRTHLPWPWRAVLLLTLLGIIGGMWWWGFDFGQIFSGFNRKEIEARIATLEADASTATREAVELRAHNTRLESELAIAQGAQATLGKQANELAQENAQIKEELAFLQALVADTSKQPGLAIQRFNVERDHGDVWRYSMLVVRGGSPKDDYKGRLALQVALAPAAPGTRSTLALPEDQPEAEAPLRLRFKYYQRVEGSFRVPPGAQVKAVSARAYEEGQTAPKTTRTLTLP